MEIDYYKDLGVEKYATTDEIKSAFRKLAHKYHPDVNKGEDPESHFRRVYKAYEVLSNPEKRSKYDSYGDTGEYKSPPYTEEQQAAQDAAYAKMYADYDKVYAKAQTYTYIYYFVVGIFILLDLFVLFAPFFEKIEKNRVIKESVVQDHQHQIILNKIDSVLKKYKSIYLYTNDTGATAKIFPDIPDSLVYGSYYGNPYDYNSWRYDTAHVNSFLKNPDLTGVVTLITLSDGKMYLPASSVYRKGEGKMLQLAIYDINDEIPHKTFKLPNGKEVVLNKEKLYSSVYLNFNSKEELIDDVFMWSIVQTFSRYPNCKLYLTPVVSNDPKKHIDSLLFKEAIISLNKKFNAINKKKQKKVIDTASFQLSIN